MKRNELGGDHYPSFATARPLTLPSRIPFSQLEPNQMGRQAK